MPIIVVFNLTYTERTNILIFSTTVRLGELDLDPTVIDNATPLDVPVERSIIHEQYSGNKMVNDIALVKLKNSVTFNGEFLNNLLVGCF